MIGDLFDSPWKILIVAVVLIVLFGSARLPVAARSLGKSMRILKTEVKGLHEDDTEPGSATPTLAPAGTQQTIASQQQLAAQLAQRQIDDPAGRQLTSKGRPTGSPKPSACSSRDKTGTPGCRHDKTSAVEDHVSRVTTRRSRSS